MGEWVYNEDIVPGLVAKVVMESFCDGEKGAYLFQGRPPAPQY